MADGNGEDIDFSVMSGLQMIHGASTAEKTLLGKRKTVADSERNLVKKHSDENEVNSVGDNGPISNASLKKFIDIQTKRALI